MKKVILGLGSNKSFGECSPLKLLAHACTCLAEVLQSPAFSSVYRTKAMYVLDQDDFYNMAVSGYVEDSMTPEALLEIVHSIENECGRDRSQEVRFGPRSLDIDIEDFDGVVMDTPDLILPHPRIKERAFVLIPLLEILNDSADEEIRNVLQSWLDKLPDQKVQKYLDEK